MNGVLKIYDGTSWKSVPNLIAHQHEIGDVNGLQDALDAADGGGGGAAGGAGGVLSGSYPNPGFAVDMATQAELDAGIATRATPADVDARIQAVVGTAPTALDTLAEIATQLQNDENAAGALTSAVAGKLAKDQNLGDLANAPTARSNLGLGTASTRGVGTSAGTVAAGNDARFGDATKFQGVPVSATAPADGQVYAYEAATNTFKPVAPTTGGSAGAETLYWADQAALYDPRAYEFVLSAAMNITVPAGECWYAINQYQINWGNDTKAGFLRPFNCKNPIRMGAGTVMQNFGSQVAYTYHCRPKSVWDIDTRYTEDPKALFYERMDRLRSLPIYEIVGTVPNAAPWGYGAGQEVAFPTDFSNGLIVGASVLDASWCGLAVFNEAGTLVANVNAMNEITNDHAVRFGEAINAPFLRIQFPKMSFRGGSKDGAAGSACLGGFGQLLYVKLPSDW